MSIRPIRDFVFKWPTGEAPETFREIAYVAAASLNEIGKALWRIAVALENEAAERNAIHLDASSAEGQDRHNSPSNQPKEDR